MDLEVFDVAHCDIMIYYKQSSKEPIYFNLQASVATELMWRDKDVSQ